MRYVVDPSRSVRLQLPEDAHLRPMSALVGTLVYRFYDAHDRLLYVGVTSRPRDRWHDHSRSAHWWPLVAAVTVTADRVPDYFARLEETRAIHDERPLYNIAKSGRTHA